MGVLEQIAHFQGRNDEGPNLALARQLAESGDETGVGEIVANLNHELPPVRADCIKVLYEVGALEPGLLARHVDPLLALLTSKHNRMVWGAMTALATIAELQTARICRSFDRVVEAFDQGSVITRDQGVRVFAALASSAGSCQARAKEVLLKHLGSCRPKDVPQHAESAQKAFANEPNRGFALLLESRLAELTPAQARRVNRVLASRDNTDS